MSKMSNWISAKNEVPPEDVGPHSFGWSKPVLVYALGTDDEYFVATYSHILGWASASHLTDYIDVVCWQYIETPPERITHDV